MSRFKLEVTINNKSDVKDFDTKEELVKAFNESQVLYNAKEDHHRTKLLNRGNSQGFFGVFKVATGTSELGEVRIKYSAQKENPPSPGREFNPSAAIRRRSRHSLELNARTILGEEPSDLRSNPDAVIRRASEKTLNKSGQSGALEDKESPLKENLPRF